MKSIKSFGNVNRVLARRQTAPTTTDTSPETTLATPEENASRSVKLFCESGGPGHTQGEEILHLPAIVEAAESSPVAAKECAYQIRKFLSKDNSSRAYVQYNAVMLIRILSDNPGSTFTKNIDKKFVDAVKELSRTSRDPSVQQLLSDTLNNFLRDKESDVNMASLLEMWKKEKVKIEKVLSQGGQPGRAPWIGHHPHPHAPGRHANNGPPGRLPGPEELASRVEEARNSATLLTQLIQSTPQSEFLQNDLIREFANRCQAASRSIQSYMATEHPAPDNDTMLTLIETNEQLSLATTKHQRAVLQTRKALGVASPDPQLSPSVGPVMTSGVAPAQPASMFKPVAPPSRKSFPKPAQPVPSERTASPVSPETENPFTDPVEPSDVATHSVIDHNEPYHPGFGSNTASKDRRESATGGATLDTTSTLKDGRNQPRDADDSDDDPYAAPVPQTTPVYRY
ncbi:hypothetical protein V501_08823 [Pseudogymnoascus sp. VKM F-4519 (FW-2642)]|nr:hypothetical protein V501_08823 [Pseudogymnoascus sp. VKM F-4519 (FW-2642)]